MRVGVGDEADGPAREPALVGVSGGVAERELAAGTEHALEPLEERELVREVRETLDGHRVVVRSVRELADDLAGVLLDEVDSILELRVRDELFREPELRA